MNTLELTQHAETYIHQFCTDTECHLEDLPSVIADWDRQKERIKGICALGWLDDDHCILWHTKFTLNLVWNILRQNIPYVYIEFKAFGIIKQGRLISFRPDFHSILEDWIIKNKHALHVTKYSNYSKSIIRNINTIFSI